MKRAAVVGLVVAGVLVLGVGGAVAVVVSNGGDDEPQVVASATPDVSAAEAKESAEPSAQNAPEKTTAEAEPSEPGSGDASTPGAYLDYSDEALASAQGQRILYFHADWCPTCRAMEKDINAVGVPDGITILKVNYDDRQDLRQQYGVTVQTTMVAIDESGNETATFVPYEAPTLDAALQGLHLS